MSSRSGVENERRRRAAALERVSRCADRFMEACMDAYHLVDEMYERAGVPPVRESAWDAAVLLDLPGLVYDLLDSCEDEEPTLRAMVGEVLDRWRAWHLGPVPGVVDPDDPFGFVPKEPPTTVCADCGAVVPVADAYTSVSQPEKVLCTGCFHRWEAAGRGRERAEAPAPEPDPA